MVCRHSIFYLVARCRILPMIKDWTTALNVPCCRPTLLMALTKQLQITKAKLSNISDRLCKKIKFFTNPPLLYLVRFWTYPPHTNLRPNLNQHNSSTNMYNICIDRNFLKLFKTTSSNFTVWQKSVEESPGFFRFRWFSIGTVSHFDTCCAVSEVHEQEDIDE